MNKVWISTKEYAKYRGITGRAVLKNIDLGRIPKDAIKAGGPGGGYLIHKGKADAALVDNLNPKLQKTKITDETKKKTIADAGIQKTSSLTEAQKLDREYQAALRKLAYQEKAGELVSKAQIEKEAFDTARRVRDALMSIPGRISAQLAAMDDRDQIHTMLTKEIRQTLTGLSE